MMTCDKQNENFITQQQQQPNDRKNINTKNTANTIISHNRSGKRNKFNRTKNLTNTRMVSLDLSPLQPQTQQLTSLKHEDNISCIMEQKQREHKQQQQQTIISKVFKPDAATMAQQAHKQTHMTLEEYFEFSKNIANSAAATTTSKRIKKSLSVQQKKINVTHDSSCDALATINTSEQEQQQQQYHYPHLKLRPTFTSSTDPVSILPNLETMTHSSASASSSSPSSSSPSPSTSCALLLTTVPATHGTLLATEFNVVAAALANVLTIPITGQTIIAKQQCNTFCINSNCGSKQKFVQQQKQKRQSKSANSIRTFTKTNINTHHSDDNADATLPTVVAATVEGITNYNNITTTSTINKANTTTNNTNNTSTAHAKENVACTAAVATRPTEITAAATTASTAPAATATATAYCKAFPLRQLFYQTTKQQECCLLRALVFSFVFVMSMQFQTVLASTSMMSKHEPMFISRSETFKFVAGDTIVLPCEVANTDPYVVAWKRGIAILTAGSVKVTPDPRVRLVNGFNLQIRDAVPQDAGDYICQIATMEPREITHTVEILVPPRIHHLSTSGHLQVKKGSSVRIECSASGNPTPNVTWSRKNNILPNGEEKLHSHMLSIENVDRHKGGVYICTANNGVGQPASSQVVLHVLYPPEITVERPVVFSGEGHEAMLVCIVHGETQPEVIWFKDTMQLDTTERHIMENRGSRHTLIIRKVHPQDFGNYSCVAENQLGKSRKTLQLSGKPNVAVFNSPPISQYKDRYNISWTVESHTPIEEYKLSFRRLQQGQEVDNSIDTHSSSSSSSSSMLQMYGGSSVGNLGAGNMMGVNAHNYRSGGMNSMTASGVYGSYGAGNVIHWGRNDWRDVVLPAIPTSHHYTQGMSYMIRGLDPDQHYEATVQARNRYGWSDFSQSFVFSTSSNDNEMRDLSVTFYGSKSAQYQTANVLLLLPVAAASLCIINFNY